MRVGVAVMAVDLMRTSLGQRGEWAGPGLTFFGLLL